jgi:hypothetical protein
MNRILIGIIVLIVLAFGFSVTSFLPNEVDADVRVPEIELAHGMLSSLEFVISYIDKNPELDSEPCLEHVNETDIPQTFLVDEFGVARSQKELSEIVSDAMCIVATGTSANIGFLPDEFMDLFARNSLLERNGVALDGSKEPIKLQLYWQGHGIYSAALLGEARKPSNRNSWLGANPCKTLRKWATGKDPLEWRLIALQALMKERNFQELYGEPRCSKVLTGSQRQMFSLAKRGNLDAALSLQFDWHEYIDYPHLKWCDLNGIGAQITKAELFIRTHRESYPTLAAIAFFDLEQLMQREFFLLEAEQKKGGISKNMSCNDS